MTPRNVPTAFGQLLALLSETDKLVDEVHTVMRRIGVELERLGVARWDLPESSRTSRTFTCPEIDSLSPRESEIVQLFMEGHRVSTIAESLFISQHTVRNHLQSVYRKLGVGSQAELIVKLKGSARSGRLPSETPRSG